MQANEVWGEADVEERRVRRELARVLFFVTVSGDEVGAVGSAIERDFTLGAAADGTDFFGLGRAESFGLTFLTDRTEHGIP